MRKFNREILEIVFFGEGILVRIFNRNPTQFQGNKKKRYAQTLFTTLNA